MIRATRVEYDKLSALWQKAYKNIPGTERKLEADNFWKDHKHDASQINEKIEELQQRITRQNVSVKHFFTTVSTKLAQAKDATVEQRGSGSSPDVEMIVEPTVATETLTEPQPTKGSTDRCHVQKRTQDELHNVNATIVKLSAIKNTGLASKEQLQQLQQLQKDAKKLEAKHKGLSQGNNRQIRYRENAKRKLAEMKEMLPEDVGPIPGSRDVLGRPRLEESQTGLREAILRIVTHDSDSAADVGRRSELMRTCLTLKDLTKRLQSEGFKISESGTYLKLLPRNAATIEGRRHLDALPVKLMRARNDGRCGHPDNHFCSASVKFLKDLAEIMGPHSVFAVSQDDKARVPLGIAAATKEAPILMHLEYRVTLPDHDFPLGSRHKLIPSVYAALVFDEKGRKLTYSGPTYVAIRSGKHDKSTATSHATDFRRLFTLESFHGLTHGSDGAAKPIVIIFSDGGPDENPRFDGVIQEAIEHFRALNLDALFVATHAPGNSAMNQVKRRMAPLSHDLSGLILPHDHYGSHLDGTRTVDKELEVRNFQRAGETLAEIWSQTVINQHSVFAEYIEPASGPQVPPQSTQEWMSKHVRSSQYLLQIMKCNDEACCGVRRTRIQEILGGQLAGPVPFKHGERGLEIAPAVSESTFFGSLPVRLLTAGLEQEICNHVPMPFDWFCPSLQGKINDRICEECGKYFSSKKSVGSHKKAMHGPKYSSIQSIQESIESVVQRYHQDESDEIVVVEDMLSWMESPFSVCTD